jgi:hypothetical protein
MGAEMMGPTDSILSGALDNIGQADVASLRRELWSSDAEPEKAGLRGKLNARIRAAELEDVEQRKKEVFNVDDTDGDDSSTGERYSTRRTTCEVMTLRWTTI